MINKIARWGIPIILVLGIFLYSGTDKRCAHSQEYIKYELIPKIEHYESELLDMEVLHDGFSNETDEKKVLEKCRAMKHQLDGLAFSYEMVVDCQKKNNQGLYDEVDRRLNNLEDRLLEVILVKLEEQL